MAEIYLCHPKHGVKIANMEMEAQYDEQHGWTRFEPEEMNATENVPDTEPLIVDPEPANIMDEPRRRGRARAEVSE